MRSGRRPRVEPEKSCSAKNSPGRWLLGKLRHCYLVIGATECDRDAVNTPENKIAQMLPSFSFSPPAVMHAKGSTLRKPPSPPSHSGLMHWCNRIQTTVCKDSRAPGCIGENEG